MNILEVVQNINMNKNFVTNFNNIIYNIQIAN